MVKQVLRGAGARRAGARLIGAYLRFALQTTRWTVDGQAVILGGDLAGHDIQIDTTEGLE